MKIPDTVALWAHGLGAAVIGGAATSISTMLVDPAKFNMTTLDGWRNLALAAGLAGLVAAAAYLKQSPLPDRTVKTVSSQSVTADGSKLTVSETKSTETTGTP